MKGLIICGSRSDWDKMVHAFLESKQWNVELDVDIDSCHRNPKETELLALAILMSGYDFVVCVGGKAFALPGVIDAWIYYWANYFGKKPVVVFGVALGEPRTAALLAAQLSIVEIPGQPIPLVTSVDAYTGLEGLERILRMAEEGHLPAAKINRPEKPAERRIWSNYIAPE